MSVGAPPPRSGSAAEPWRHRPVVCGEPMNPSDASLDRSTLLALLEASRAIIGETEPSDVFRRIVERAAAVLRGEGASLLLFDRARGATRVRGDHGAERGEARRRAVRREAGHCGRGT